MRLSIKFKVTLFYAIVFTLILALVLTFLLYITNWQITVSSKDELESGVKNAINELYYYDNRLEIPADFDFYMGGIAIVIYDAKGNLLAGSTPLGFPAQTPLISEMHRQIDSVDSWQVYDMYTHNIWVRGVHSTNSVHAAIQSTMRIMLIALPAIFILAVLGGYFITKRAFSPIKHISATAKNIKDGEDLSRRINLGGKDEMHELSAVFDEMFERLEAAFENEKQFVSDASHELRTPVSVIISECEYALSKKLEGSEHFESILEQSSKMARLITSLLELSRTCEIALNKENINISELCEIIAEDFEEAAAKEDIRFVLSVGHNIMLHADQMMIIRLMNNLVSNAIRYGKKGGYVEIRVFKTEQIVHIEVSDDGVGIPEQHLERIFNRFYQADASRSKGSGLGLSMVKWICSAHGGGIRVESKENLGSTFYITLPDIEN